MDLCTHNTTFSYPAESSDLAKVATPLNVVIEYIERKCSIMLTLFDLPLGIIFCLLEVPHPHSTCYILRILHQKRSVFHFSLVFLWEIWMLYFYFKISRCKPGI